MLMAFTTSQADQVSLAIRSVIKYIRIQVVLITKINALFEEFYEPL